ncbi:MAG: hypothetical protein AAGK21_13960, partial [Bacteroidota bacterium]
LASCGLVFALGGLAILTPPQSRMRDAAALTIVLTFAILGGWVAIFSDPGQVEGGLPFLPRAVNEALGRGLFGFGSLISLALFVYGVRRLVRNAPEADAA